MFSRITRFLRFGYDSSLFCHGEANVIHQSLWSVSLCQGAAEWLRERMNLAICGASVVDKKNILKNRPNPSTTIKPP